MVAEKTYTDFRLTIGISNISRYFPGGLHCQRHNCWIDQYVARNRYRQRIREFDWRLSH